MKHWHAWIILAMVATSLTLANPQPAVASAATGTTTAEFYVQASPGLPRPPRHEAAVVTPLAHPIDQLPGTDRPHRLALPQTGDQANWPLMLCGLALLAALASTLRPRKEARQHEISL